MSLTNLKHHLSIRSNKIQMLLGNWHKFLEKKIKFKNKIIKKKKLFLKKTSTYFKKRINIYELLRRHFVCQCKKNLRENKYNSIKDLYKNIFSIIYFKIFRARKDIIYVFVMIFKKMSSEIKVNPLCNLI